MSTEGVRIDKWLWAVRLYKTRSLATEACKAGKIKIDGQPVKPSRDARIGDVLTVNLGTITRTVEIKALLHNRVGAKLVPDFLIDLTPPEEYERQQMIRELNGEKRPKGAGRPTKLERRLIDRLKNSF